MANQPYKFYIENNSDKEQDCIIFGCNISEEPNYDSGIGIKIDSENDYKNTLEQIKQEPFLINKITITSSSQELKCKGRIEFIYENESRDKLFKKTIPIIIYINPYLKNEEIEITDLNEKIYDKAYIKINIPPYSKFTISVYWQKEPPSESEKGKHKISYPDIFHISNKSDVEATARLYGYAKFIDRVNFGSDPGIEITTNDPDIKYSEYLRTSALDIFQSGTTRIYCSSEKYDEILDNTKIKLFSRGLRGKMYSDEIPIRVFRNIFQENHRVVDVDYAMTINANSYIEIKVPPQADLTLCNFPQKLYTPMSNLRDEINIIKYEQLLHTPKSQNRK